MPENRTDRTDYLGLLALMASAEGGGPSADAQGWGMPYWNQVQLDAAIAALYDAPRDGTVLLTAPASAPSYDVTNAGQLPAGRVYDICQTFVDEYGRETGAGVAAEVDLGDPLEDPSAAATVTGLTEVAAGAGFDGGLLEVWYAWIDDAAGETLPSPAVVTDVPYRAGGLQTEVAIQLPCTPDSVGAAGANVYVRHRGGNVVLAYVLTDELEDEVALDASWVSCFQGLPLANTTYAQKAIAITGIAAPETAARTRFYLRPSGEEWTAGDRRLHVGGVDEWDPDTVVYPLTFTGASGQLAPGYPPTTSQVKPIRPVDLSLAEAMGTLPAANLPDEVVLETELVKSTGEGVLTGLAVAAHTPADLGVQVGTGEALNTAGRHVFAEATDLVIPAADVIHPRIDLICLADDGTLEGPTENANLKGSPAAEPLAPSTPVGYIKLAEVTVDAEETEIAGADIEDTRYLLPTLVSLDEALDTHKADTDVHLTAVQKTGLTGGGETELHTHPGSGISGGRLTAQLALSVLDDEEWLLQAHRSLRDMQLREIETMLSQIEDYSGLQPHLEAHRAMIDSFASAYFTADGVVEGLVASDGGSLTLSYTAGKALVGATEYLAIGASSIALTDDATNYVYVGADGNMAKQTTGWPETAHAKVCTAVAASGSIGTIDNSVKVSQSAYDGVGDQLVGVVGTLTPIWASDTSTDYSTLSATSWRALRFTPGAGTKQIIVKAYIKTANAGAPLRVRVTGDDNDKPDMADVMATKDFADTSGGSDTVYWTDAIELGELEFGAGTYWVVFSAPTSNISMAWKSNVPVYGAGTSDSGATWGSSHTVVGAISYLTTGETTWLSREVALSGTVTRILESHRRAASSGAWDADLYAVTVEARLDGGTWQEITSGTELLPDPSGSSTLEVKVTLSSLDTSKYPLVAGLGVIWEE